jgi:2-polyprenyl-6-methoxyphenol hydroxylase-like FAD-dependent oxidoreductase
MTASWDICIRGGGLVGRTLALLLSKSPRMRVLLAEQAPSAAPDVRAYALNEASRQVLSSVGCWPDSRHATPVQTMQVWGDTTGLVRFDSPTPLGLTTIVDVPALEDLLDQAVRQRPNITRQTEPASATLTIICEGRQSASRDQLGVQVERLPYHQHALACRVRTAQPHRQQALQWFSATPQGSDIVALLPMDGQDGSVSAVIWSTSPEHARALQAMDEGAFNTALQQATHHHLGALSCLSARAIWPLQLQRARTWCGEMAPGQAWVLAGDAAHGIHPLAGQGLNLGLADVAELSRVLARTEAHNHWRALNDRQPLRRYERTRKADMQATWLACDGLQRLFSHPNASVQSVRNWGLSAFDRCGPVKHWTLKHAMSGQ